MGSHSTSFDSPIRKTCQGECTGIPSDNGFVTEWLLIDAVTGEVSKYEESCHD